MRRTARSIEALKANGADLLPEGFHALVHRDDDDPRLCAPSLVQARRAHP